MRSRFLVFCLVLISVGCGDKPAANSNSKTTTTTTTNTAATEAAQFTIAESAYAVSKPMDDIYIKWVAVVENPNKDKYASYSAVTVTARDESGGVLSTEDAPVGELPPGFKIAVAGQLSVKGMPASVEIKPSKVEWKATKTTGQDYRVFAIQKPVMTSSGKDLYQVTGEITNPFDKEVDSMRVVVLLRDAEGKLIGGGATFPDALPGSGSRPFEVKLISAKGKPASNEVFAYPHGQVKWNDLVGPK